MRQIFRSPFKVTQTFGVNAAYYGQFGLKGHEGLDLVPTTSDWTIISPIGDGVVVRDIDDPKAGGAYGNTCTVWYKQLNIALQFCHMSENYLKLNDTVTLGQAIGKMGDTGNTMGAHLHLNRFEVDANGVRLNKTNGFLGGTDPLPFLQESTTTTGNMIQVDSKVYEGLITKLDTQEKLIQNLNQQINDRNNDITKLNATVSTKDSEIASLTQQKDMAEEQAKRVPELVKKVEDYEEYQKTWRENEKQYLATITRLKKDSANALSISDLISLLLKKIARQ